MLDTPLSSLIRTTKSRISTLESRGIQTLRDLLLNLPWRYADETEFGAVEQLNALDAMSVQGEVSKVSSIKTRNGKYMIRGVFSDETGKVDVMWFGQAYLKQVFAKNQKVVLTGKVKFASGKKTMVSPKVEVVKVNQDLMHSGRVVPVYHEFEQITSKWLREKIYPLLYATKFFEENLPLSIIDTFGLMPRSEALSQVHFPDNEESLQHARHRLGFEEMLVIQLGVLKRKFDLKANFDGSANWCFLSNFRARNYWKTILYYECMGCNCTDWNFSK